MSGAACSILPAIMNTPSPLTRREMLARTALLASAASLARGRADAAEGWPPPVVVFSKVYQELKLDFEQGADLTAEAGLDGIDCPVRPKGEVEPERAADDLPRYAEALRKRKVDVRLITTGILGVDSPHAEDILRTATKLGIVHYRIGSMSTKESTAALVPELKAKLKDLAAMNRQIGVTAVVQNHSGKYVAGDLNEMYEIVKDFDPAQVAVAFDLGHAIITHGDEWPVHFERLKPHIKVAYVKDSRRPKEFVPFGQGEFGKTDIFRRIRQAGITAPLSMHVEFDWAAGAEKTRAGLLKTLRDCRREMGLWMAKA